MYQKFVLVLIAVSLTGCMKSEPPSAPKPKTTDKIGEFDPNADNKVVKPDVHITNPITGPLEAFHPVMQQIATIGIEHAVNLFNASEGRYPNSHEEFMTRIVKENNMRLPVLQPGMEYQYDVENHKLVVIKKKKKKTP